jgi:hypothetical protein
MHAYGYVYSCVCVRVLVCVCARAWDIFQRQKLYDICRMEQLNHLTVGL